MRLCKVAALSLAISTLSSNISYGVTWNLKNDTWYCDTTGWVESTDGWYYTDPDGKMLTDNIVDGYYLSSTGRMINPTSESEKIANQLLDNIDVRVSDMNVREVLECFTGYGYQATLCHWTYSDGRVEYGFSDTGKEQIIPQIKTIDNWIKHTDGLFDASVTEHDKVRAIHNFVIDTFDYGETENLSKSLITGQAVCAQYAALFQLLCEYNGIDCDYVEGEAFNTIEIAPHAWNRVYVDGEAYLVDCCWDDTAKTDAYFMKKTFNDHYEK